MDAHRDPEAMARVLVSYIADDRKVRSAILSEFVSAPGLSRIARIRAKHNASLSRFRRGRVGCGDYAAVTPDWRGDQHRRDMQIASAVFVKSIIQQRGARV